MEGKHGLRNGLKTGFDLSHPTNRGFFSLQGMTFSTELVMIEGLEHFPLAVWVLHIFPYEQKKMLFATFGVFCKIFPQEWGDREVFCRFFPHVKLDKKEVEMADNRWSVFAQASSYLV